MDSECALEKAKEMLNNAERMKKINGNEKLSFEVRYEAAVYYDEYLSLAKGFRRLSYIVIFQRMFEWGIIILFVLAISPILN